MVFKTHIVSKPEKTMQSLYDSYTGNEIYSNIAAIEQALGAALLGSDADSTNDSLLKVQAGICITMLNIEDAFFKVSHRIPGTAQLGSCSIDSRYRNYCLCVPQTHLHPLMFISCGTAASDGLMLKTSAPFGRNSQIICPSCAKVS